jgi:hypothetical protein
MPGFSGVRVTILGWCGGQSRTGDPIGGEINNFHSPVENCLNLLFV